MSASKKATLDALKVVMKADVSIALKLAATKEFGQRTKILKRGK